MKNLIYLLILLISCEVKKADDNSCKSFNLNDVEKRNRNLFLDFFYQMNKKEFSVIQDGLISSGKLKKDSVVKFMFNVEDANLEEKHCEFILTPNFDTCRLYKISLEYLPLENHTAALKSGYNGNTPSGSTVQAIEKLYFEKYGSPIERTKYKISWNDGNRKIYFLKEYEQAYGFGIDIEKSGELKMTEAKDFDALTKFSIEYISVEEEKKKIKEVDSLQIENDNLKKERIKRSKESI